MSTHVEGKKYDIIFAGGGTAACVAAGRLAKNNPDLSILLIERGKNNKDDLTVVNPAMFMAHLAPDSQTALFYKGNAEEQLNGREIIVPCGGLLGGGSSINFMMYTRAQAIDFDSWKTEGWDYKSLLPLLKRLETFHLEDEGINKDLHGYDGPINVSWGPHFQEKAAADLIAGAVATGEKEFVDMQDFEAVGGYARWAKYISPDGKRQDSAHCYIHPLLDAGKHPNLHLLLENRVSRVLFDDNKRAIGVEYEPDPAFQITTALSSAATTKFQVYANKLVVVSAGTLSTPSILERSGVGDSKILSKLGIDVVSDLPDVGEHYQDHQLSVYPYKTSLGPQETLDIIISGRYDVPKALETRDSMLGWNCVDVCSKDRPTEAEVATMGEDFKKVWEADFKNFPSKPTHLCGVVSAFLGDHKVLPEEKDGPIQYTTLGNYTAYPYSRGNIHITSTDVNTPASFNSGFLNHPADLPVQVWSYKKQREVYRRTNAYRGELAFGHPNFPEGSKAGIHEGAVVEGGFSDAASRKAITDLEYSAEDDKAIEEHIKNNISTTWHSCGTCRMAPRDEGGVVDAKLNVYGVTGLKVVDLSIVPHNVGANTNNTALLVGEKAADIIAGDFGIKL